MRFHIALALLAFLAALPAAAQDDTAALPIVSPPAGAVLVPDHFLRRWDPVTVFFDHDAGAPAGTPDDAPENLVTVSPPQPGAWTWLGPRVLQFRPATPWPPLSSFDFHVQGAPDVTLSRLLDPTVQTDPANGAADLRTLSTLSLTFSEPLDVTKLPGMLDIAISPLPGLDAAQAQHLTPADFDIKTVERTSPGDNATYLVELHKPVPDGMRVDVAIGLSPVPGLAGTVEHLSFTTATPFRPTSIGCAGQLVPLSASGTIYDRDSALACGGAAPADQNNPDQDNADQDNGADNSQDMSQDNSQDNSAENSSDNAQDNADQSADNTQAGGSTPDATAPSNAPIGQMPVTTKKTPTIGTPDPQAGAAPATPDAPKTIAVDFSASPAPIDPIAARNLIRITPAVDGIVTSLTGAELDLTADFKTGTLYKITLEPAALKDVNGRALALTGESAVWLFWPPQADTLALRAGNGVIERFGPQMIPLIGRGYEEADLRIHQIDPLDRSFWPFPATPITTNDNDRPPAPGEQPPPYTGNDPIDTGGLQAQIGRLGSPAISTLTPLPLTAHGASATFGLNLTDQLARLSGRKNPGTYLIGLRALDAAGDRAWMRVQVTDLSLTTIEEEHAVRFYVTSLATGQPVAGAKIEVDGIVDGGFAVIDSGATGPDGAYEWQVADQASFGVPARIVVTKDDDTLVLNTAQPPDRYTANGWSTGQGDGSDWLGWTAARDFSDRHPKPQTLCHVFTERPIYRPEDAVHIKTYIRTLTDGILSPGAQNNAVQLVVTGPDTTTNWTYNLKPDSNGDADYLFNAKTTATGAYQAEIDVDGTACASVNFTKDAYRLPRFMIRMEGPDSIPLDKPASVAMTATYYAGGPVGGRPVRLRVTQFPYAFSPAARPGFVYATSAMFQPDYSFQASAATEQESTTDAQGHASITIDPTQNASNAARRYVVEATVTGDDDKTVTNTQDVLALPSFVLGLQAPRFLAQATAIPVQYLMVDAQGKPIAGRPITLRLLRRQWSSILQASDFSDGKAKYQTEVVDEKLLERTVISGADAEKLMLPIDRAGVYIVQLEAADALGRLQTVSLDMFAGGANGVTWSHPPATTFQVTTDKPAYAPGDTAKLILQSPFQTARALAIAELPGGDNTYQWLDVKNGYAVYSLPITRDFMPRIPVHFVLMRGRLPGDDAIPALDLRRPETIAATAWIGVTPVKNIVTASVTAPAQALPGATVQLTVKLADDQGKPIAGSVTLWLLDQAVLALQPEAPLDPLPDFIRDRGSRVAFSDTRNLPFGLLPLDENAGGEAPAAALAPAPPPPMDLLDKVTVRKNFNPMPYYNPSLVIGPSGTATVSIKLPDDLTIFKIRAIADAGPERFGFATGQIAVRLPVIVEPNLPRFVRPGDSFSLAGLGRIVDGPGGPGAAQLAVDGLNVAGPLTQNFNWRPGMSQAFAFPASVENPGYDKNGNPVRTSVRVTLAVIRNADKAMDAFQVNLPIQPDRDFVHQRQITDLTSAKPLNLAAIPDAARPGTIRRQILVSSQPELVRLFAGLDYLRVYPFGCTEQRVSLARAEIAAKIFSSAMDQNSADRTDADVNQTLAWIASATDGNGLVAFWPGDRGVVTLTAWSLEFMVEAQQAGYTVDPVEQATLVHALQQALRSDYSNFVSGGAYVERAWALAALAYDGHLDRDYADELARQRDQLTLEGIAQVSISLQQDKTNAPAQAPLQQALWTGIVTKLRDGKPVYAGLQEGANATTDYPDIFPSETRTLAEMLRATADTTDPRRKLIVDALVTLGNGDGWGSTNGDAEAFLALTAYLKSDTLAPPQTVTLTPTDSAAQKLALSGTRPLQRVVSTDGAAVNIVAAGATPKNPVSVQNDLSWLPVQDGSQVAPTANGFVVTSEADKINMSPGGPPTKTLLDHPGITLNDKVGDVIEEHLQVINPQERHYVAISVPLAAGMEPMDPALATAPPEAKPSAPPTFPPSYTAFLDDKVTYFYDDLPAGTYDFYFRTKAAVPGRFIQPAASAIMMYDDAVNGTGPGAVVQIAASQ